MKRHGYDVAIELLDHLRCARASGFGREVSLGERAAGTGLQIPFEPRRGAFIWELENHDGYPRPIHAREAAGTLVVPTQPLFEISSDSSVMTLRIGGAAQNVDEPPADAFHGQKLPAGFGPTKGKELSSLAERPPSRLRRFGETDFTCR